MQAGIAVVILSGDDEGRAPPAGTWRYQLGRELLAAGIKAELGNLP